MKATIAGNTTVYVGNWFEWAGGVGRAYYYLGGQRIATRTGTTVHYLVGDSLGSTSVSLDSTQAGTGETRYKAWGEQRTLTGSFPTTYRFTGQRLDEGVGLYYYGARYYDHCIARWTQPDSTIPQPGNPQSLNRYSYTLNNPLKYIDPTGHDVGCPGQDASQCPTNPGYPGTAPSSMSSVCKGNQCQLDPRLKDIVMYYATLYGIDPDLLYVTLLTELQDDVQLLQPPFDALNLSGAYNAANGLGDAQALGWAWLSIGSWIESVLHPNDSPGLGYNNIHSGTAWETQEYFAQNYPFTAMSGYVKPNSSLPQIILTLATTDGNIRYAAAHLRQLSDLRTGKTEPHNALTVDEQEIIYGAYRAGPDTYDPVGGYQSVTTPGEYGQRYLRYYQRAYGPW